MPRGFVDPVTTSRLPSLAKLMIADLAQVFEANISGIALKLFEDIFNLTHILYSITIDTTVKEWFFIFLA